MSLVSLLTCCCSRSVEHVDNDDPDERTRLLDSDVIPVAPQDTAQVTNSEEEVAHQEALRRIVDEASERLLNIAAPSPMAQFSPSMWLAAYYPERQILNASSDRSANLPYSSKPGAHLRASSSFPKDHESLYRSKQYDSQSNGGFGGGHRQLRSELSNHSLKTLPALSSPPMSPSSTPSLSPPASSSPPANLGITPGAVGASSVSSNATLKQRSPNQGFDLLDDNTLTLKPSLLARGEYSLNHSDLNDNIHNSHNNSSSNNNHNLSQHPPFSFGIVTMKEDQFMKKLGQTIEIYYSNAFQFPPS